MGLSTARTYIRFVEFALFWGKYQILIFVDLNLYGKMSLCILYIILFNYGGVNAFRDGDVFVQLLLYFDVYSFLNTIF